MALIVICPMLHFCLFQAVNLLYSKLVNMFHFVGDKRSTASCPVALKPDLNPSSGIQSYRGGDASCSETTFYHIPFFLDRMGPKSSDWSISAHETSPGHHLQVKLICQINDESLSLNSTITSILLKT